MCDVTIDYRLFLLARVYEIGYKGYMVLGHGQGRGVGAVRQSRKETTIQGNGALMCRN